jgi:hypothetical protein
MAASSSIHTVHARVGSAIVAAWHGMAWHSLFEPIINNQPLGLSASSAAQQELYQCMHCTADS